jgi:hypothetical protein
LEVEHINDTLKVFLPKYAYQEVAMFCPSCGKEITTNSQFCQHCGKSLNSKVIVSPASLRWEYKDMVFPNGVHEGKTIPEVAKSQGEKAPFLSIGDQRTVSSALNEMWVTWEREVHDAIKEETKQGWEPDPNGWGSSCIEYQTRTVGMSYWGGGQWVAYILLGVVSSGLGFLLMPFIMRFQIIEPIRIKTRLRRLKNI